MGDYVRNITCTALILGALGSLCGTGEGVRKVVFGLLLGFVVISPLRDLEFGEWMELPGTLYREGEAVRDEAVKQTNADIRAVIKEEVASYILVEAGSLGAEIQVEEIGLDPDTMVPVSVLLSGELSAYDRTLLSSYLSEELGIGKEGQRWMEP